MTPCHDVIFSGGCLGQAVPVTGDETCDNVPNTKPQAEPAKDDAESEVKAHKISDRWLGSIALISFNIWVAEAVGIVLSRSSCAVL